MLTNGRPYDERILDSSRLVVYPSKLGEFFDRKWIKYSPVTTIILVLAWFVGSERVVKFLTSSYDSIVVVASYNKLQSFILKSSSCANRIELQHGHIHSNHEHYTTVSELVDVFWVWSKTYAAILHNLNSDIDCVVIGEPFKIITTGLSNQIILIDQWSIRPIIKEAESRLLSAGFEDLKIKMHPNKKYWNNHEYSSEVICDSRRFLELDETPRIVIGGFSTALYEAALMGSEVYCIDQFYEDNMLEFKIRKLSDLKD